MRIAFVAVLCLFLAGHAIANDRVHEGYKGADGGVLIFSSGSIGEELNFVLYYKKVGAFSRYQGAGAWISYDTTSIFARPADFTGRENGQVKTVRLEPGNYEIYSFDIRAPAYMGANIWSPAKEFSIPFTIETGKSTYIGDFAGIRLTGKDWLNATVTAGGIIVVRDEQARDIPIAQKQMPDLPPVTISVTDVSKLVVPGLLATAPAN